MIIILLITFASALLQRQGLQVFTPPIPITLNQNSIFYSVPKQAKEKQIISLEQTLHDGVLYTSDIYVGTPPQKLRALFDTGSSNTWLAGSILKQSVHSDHFFYNPLDSSTSLVSNKTAHMRFGTGSLSGRLASDDIRLGNITL